jgi:hypothetical protein
VAFGKDNDLAADWIGIIVIAGLTSFSGGVGLIQITSG